MDAVTPFLEVSDAIKELGAEDLDQCMQCGTCTGVCPWSNVKYFSPRGMIRLAQFGLEGFESEELWNCVTCNTCVINCPRGLKIIDIIRSMRMMMNETGSIPASLKVPIGSATSRGNPWSGEADKRTEWAKEIDVPLFEAGKEYLYFTCCTQAYDPRNQKIGRALVSLLKIAGIDFGLLGNEEKCCGDAIRKMGAEELFMKLAENNIGLMSEKEVRTVITASPHCYNTFTKEYPELGAEFNAIHYTQLLDKLIKEGILKPKKSLDIRVTYHDPCYLGRHNGIYDPPRDILKAIPGITLVEMGRNRENSLCCGGGGGGLWNEIPQEERFSVLRVQEAIETGADILAASCPYCISMFEDAVKTVGKEEELKVMDISEILLESLEG